PIALGKPSCYRIARRAMRRAVMSFAYSDVLAADETIRPLVEGTFSVHDGGRSIVQAEKPLPVVLVGGVVVTGSTIARFSRRTDAVIQGTVHLAAHGQHVKSIMVGSEILALRWMPPRTPAQTSPR